VDLPPEELKIMVF